MLQKLKLKLVIINVVLITAALVAVFAAAYFLLESQLKNQETALLSQVAAAEIIKPLDSLYTTDFIELELELESNYESGEDYEHDYDEYIYNIWDGFEFLIEDEDYMLPFASSRMFNVKIYSNDETAVISSAGVFRRTEEIIYLLDKVDMIDKISGEVDLTEYIKLSFLTAENPGIRVYVFIERETREKTMAAYVYTAFIALTGSVICVFLISVYMAGRAIKPVKESIERQEKFITDASHELRTPIAVIRSNAELVMDAGSQTVGENMKWLEYIHKESVRMTKMTESLLLLSQADAKNGFLTIKENINLSVLVSEVYDSFGPLFAENKIDAKSADIEPDIYIRANEQSIKQLVTIFLDNAVKYTKENGEISVKLDKSGGYAYIKITDTGIGIPEEMLGKIFERFFRIDKARAKSTGGSGLGLSIAKTITDEHNGEITVESEQGKGSEFCVKLPVVLNL